jgi:7-dehydrocholesterol reductase
MTTDIFRDLIAPALLIISTFPFAFTMVYANTTRFDHGLNASLQALVERIWSTRGQVVVDAFHATWPKGEEATEVATMLAVYVVFQLALVRLVPGPTVRGPISPKGAVPVYVNNGLLSFVIAVAAFLVATVGLKVVSAARVLYLYPSMLCVMSVLSLVFCALLYAKGVYAPSGPDSDSAGNPILDYYAGRELYPRVLGWDIKQFTNCRFGMMAWGLLPIAFVAGTIEAGKPLTNGQIVNLILNLVYVAKVRGRGKGGRREGGGQARR